MLSYIKRNSYYFVVGLLLIVLFGEVAMVWRLIATRNKLSNKEESVALVTQAEQAAPATLTVEIKGAINKPGIYEMARDDVIDDVIKQSGGLLANAYPENINLSQKVAAEMVIYIYTQEEYGQLKVTPNYEICYIDGYDIKKCLENGYSVIVSSTEKITTFPSASTCSTTTKTNSSSSEKKPTIININTATVQDFLNLPGIGEVKAQAIVAYRQEQGNFATIDALKNVKGIGDTTFEKIKNYLTI